MSTVEPGADLTRRIERLAAQAADDTEPTVAAGLVRAELAAVRAELASLTAQLASLTRRLEEQERASDERLESLRSALADEVRAAAAGTRTAVTEHVHALVEQVLDRVEALADGVDALGGLVGGFRKEWPVRTLEVVQGARVAAEAAVREVRTEVGRRLDDVATALQAMGGLEGADGGMHSGSGAPAQPPGPGRGGPGTPRSARRGGPLRTGVRTVAVRRDVRGPSAATPAAGEPPPERDAPAAEPASTAPASRALPRETVAEDGSGSTAS